MFLILYRVKLESTETQLPIFPVSSEQKRELLRASITEQPFLEVRKGQTWGIGNLETIGNDYLTFYFGKTARKREGQLDKTNKIFFEVDSDEAKFARGYYDSHYQVLALETNSSLPRSLTVAKYFEKVIASTLSKIAIHTLQPEYLSAASKLHPHVKTIRNPEKFITTIHTAFKVTSITLKVNRPNNWDPEKDFQAPLSKATEIFGGDSTTATIKTDSDLNREKIESVAHAAAAAGDELSAQVEDRIGDSKRTIRLDAKYYPAQLEISKTDISGKIERTLKLIRELYERIRKDV